MPQLWRSLSGSGNSRTPVKSETSPPGPMKLIIAPPPRPPMTHGNFWPSSSAPSSPSSPEPPGAAGLNQSPHYDRLLNELRLAQERRGKKIENDSKNPPVSPIANTLNGAPPSGAYINHFNSAGAARFDRLNGAVSPLRTRSANGKCGPAKKVRFLEDGTGNLHTSVFGGSADSITSLLDVRRNNASNPQRETNGGTEDIDSLIASLIHYEQQTPPQQKETNSTSKISSPRCIRNAQIFQQQPNHQPQQPQQPQNKPQQNNNNHHQSPVDQLTDFLDILRCAEVVEQRQTIVHLEPDEPSSVDSGSVLSELDFEETSSTITETYSTHSPELGDQGNEDLFAEVSDLLERSLQEIRRMEEDTQLSNNKTPEEDNNKPPVSVEGKTDVQPAPVSRREPLYELIGWKRNPPPAQLDLRGAKPLPPLPLNNPQLQPVQPQVSLSQISTVPASVPTPAPVDDVWVPRRDWVPPSNDLSGTSAGTKQPDKPWLRNQPINFSRRNQLAVMEENPIYGRLWESNSSHNSSSSGRSSSSSADDIIKSNTDQHQLLQPQQTQPDLSAIRSMARKARMEHWRMTGLSGPDGEDSSGGSNRSSEVTTLMSQLPLVRINNGFQITWPPPPLPPSTSSSAVATPVTPTQPDGFGVAAAVAAASIDHSPKCFGHQRVFQWPVPPVKSLNQYVKVAPVPAQNKPQIINQARPPRPTSLDDAQDWYWIEEFPRAAGLEPGTGNMTTWFHGAITRQEAERRLMADQPTGAFLARLTERLWGYALSVRNPAGGVSHFLIDAGERTRRTNSSRKYTLLGSTDPPHKSLRELIQYYSKQTLTPDGMEKLLFPCPQESAVNCSSSHNR